MGKEGGRLLSGSYVCIVGFVHIGTDTDPLIQPFNCQVLICDMLDKSEAVDAYGVTQVSLEQLLAEANVVSLHVTLTELTHFMVNDEFLQQMKPHAHLVNNSRGPAVNQQALKNALQQKIIAGAASDVYELEPPEDVEFLSFLNPMGTPHIGGNANEALLAMRRSAIRHLKEFFSWIKTNELPAIPA